MLSASRDLRLNVARRRLARFLEDRKDVPVGALMTAELLYGHDPVEHLHELRLIAMDRGYQASDLAAFNC